MALDPADFGIVAAAMTVISMGQIVLGLGMGPAVVQRRTDVDEAAFSAFWIGVLFAVGLYGILWILAPWISQIYKIPAITAVMRVSGLSLPLSALSSIPTALLQRNLDFRGLFWINSVPPIISGAISVGLAFAGIGFWALVLGPLIGTGVSAMLAWRISGWLPSFVIDWQVAWSLIGFGSWVMLASTVTWFFGQADNALCGYYLGATTLGVYSLGFNLSSLFPGLVISPLAAVAYPAFCEVQNERKELGHIFIRLQSLIAAVLFPLALGLSATAAPGVNLLYGGRWHGLSLVIQLLAIMPGLSHVWSLNAEAYRAIGRPDVWPKLGCIALLVLMPSLVLTAPHGLFVFTLARLLGASILPLLIILVTPRVLGISLKEQSKAIGTPFVCSGVMFVAAHVLINILKPFEGVIGWLNLLMVILISTMLYLFLLGVMRRDLLDDLLLAWRRILFKPNIVA